MADIADAKANINDVEVDADAALSEALFEKIGGAINYLNTTTDTHETEITALQTATLTKGSTTTGTNPLSAGTLESESITPTSTNVLVIVGGKFSTDNVSGSGCTLTLKRGAATLYAYTYTQNTDDITLPSFLDTGATADSSNTYTLEVSSISGVVNASYHYLHLINIK